MSQHVTPCNKDQLRRLLSGQLDDAAEREVTEHVAGCTDCQQQLEGLAGEPSWWRLVEASLRVSSAKIPTRSATESKASSHAGLAPHAIDDSYIADFAVAFLEPCNQPGTLGRLEDIEILEVIGHGGMGIVLKGFQRELGRYVAVKVLAPHLAASGAARTRFSREGRAAAAVVHPHVMAIHAVYSSGRLPLLVMPYLACESLQQRLDRSGSLELNEILRIGHQIADGLAAAHAQGLVHRDVKPANILLERGIDRVLLTDFGLARAADDASLTRTGIIAGTPQYMSPEQARGDAVDARSDLFSLGSVLYTMAAGRPPFRAETSYGILRRITDSEPHSLRELNPAIPAWLEAIIRRLHAKAANERFASAAEVATLLAKCLAHVQQPVAVPLPKECVLMSQDPSNSPAKAVLPRSIRSKLKWVLKSILLLLMVGFGFAVYVYLDSRRIMQESGLSRKGTGGTSTATHVAAAPNYSYAPAANLGVAEEVSLQVRRDYRDERRGYPGNPQQSAPHRPSVQTEPDPMDMDEPFVPDSRDRVPQWSPPVASAPIASAGPQVSPEWDHSARQFERFGQMFGNLEQQDWSSSNFPAAHRPQDTDTDVK